MDFLRNGAIDFIKARAGVNELERLNKPRRVVQSGRIRASGRVTLLAARLAEDCVPYLSIGERTALSAKHP